MASDFFRIEVQDGVARCTMCGPNMNAMGADMAPAVQEGFQEIMRDDSVKVIVIRGDGGNFSTGADLSFMGEKMDPLVLRDAMQAMGSVIYELHEGSRPVIAEVDGWAVGGGFSLALASDLTFATDRARFLMSFVRISLVPDFGASYFLAHRCGLAQAKELVLAGNVIDAQEAWRLGLVNRVLAPEEIEAETMKVARRLATRPAVVLQMIKHNVNMAHHVDLRTYLDLEAHAQALFVMSEEHQRDVEKFFKKEGRY
jgi:2-(1,2-epoxy-1,2-dihydrophenyl)acetyl-CoA isomerase